MFAQLRPALAIFVLFTVLTGVIYPITITGLAQAIFPHQANGSLIEINGKIAGSELIGQPFSEPSYFWGRLSATAPFPYNAAASSGSNLGPTNPSLETAVRARAAALRAADPQNSALIPVDLVTASGSGLDPHISIMAAEYQIPRVARARAVSEAEIRSLVDSYSIDRLFWIFGEPRVNVLELNLALDLAYPIHPIAIESMLK